MNCNQSEQAKCIIMPLLMGFTNATEIQEDDHSSSIIYDPHSSSYALFY